MVESNEKNSVDNNSLLLVSFTVGLNPFSIRPVSTAIIVGSNVEIICNVQGLAIWSKNSQILNNSHQFMKLTNVIEEDSGFYVCTGRSPYTNRFESYVSEVLVGGIYSVYFEKNAYNNLASDHHRVFLLL